jgi:hypothetical protein
MEKINNCVLIDGIQTIGKCRENSFYVRFTEEDIDELAKYAFDMGYTLEPELMVIDPQHPMRFKIISKANPSVYGWISKVVEKRDEQWKEAFLYGFYRYGSFRIKYPITFNVNSTQMRGILKRKAVKNPHLMTYFRTLFGILDLEPQVSPLDFIFSWLWSINFKRLNDKFLA